MVHGLLLLATTVYAMYMYLMDRNICCYLLREVRMTMYWSATSSASS